MKTLTLFFVFFGFYLFSVTAQYYPGGINYQAVARDNSGNELKNKIIDVRVSIISGNPEGDIEYSETTSVTTDGFGLFSFVIGQGSRFAGKKNSLAEVSWGSAPHFLKVEVDFIGNGDYIDMNPLPLQAVPYALHAGTAANAMSSTNYQQLSFDPSTKKLSLEEGGSVDLSSMSQYLSFQNNVLSLTNANSVPLDNLLQNLQLTQDHKLKITNNPQALDINLGVYLDNTDNQTLSIVGDSLAITGGNKVKVDLSDTNEIQDLELTDDILKISMNQFATPIDLSKYHQQLSLNGYDLSLENGGSVNIRPEVVAFRATRVGGNSLAGSNVNEMKFMNTSLNTNNCFDQTTGRFTVPQNGGGLYKFDIIYNYKEFHAIFFTVYNGEEMIYEERLFEWLENNIPNSILTFNTIINLNEGDKVSLYLKNLHLTQTIWCQPAIFSGYRIH